MNEPPAKLGGHCFILIATMAFLTVVDLFAAQALLPALAERYGVTPSIMGLAVNASTLGMAIAGLAVAMTRWEGQRRTAISSCLALLAVPTLLLAVAPNIEVFAGLRVIQGLIMATAFSLTLGYMADRYAASIVASAFAAYITGNVASNFFGRLISVAVYDHSGLSSAFVALATLNLLGTGLALRLFSGETRTTPADKSKGIWRAQLSDPALRSAFLIGFLILFAFLGVFTYVNFHLVRHGFGLTMAEIGLIHVLFIPSVFTTPLSARLTARLSYRVALLLYLAIALAGLPLLLSDSIAPVATGLCLIAIGTFAAQAAATSFVGVAARTNRTSASGFYLAAYYIGGLTGTALIGGLYDRLGWLAAVSGVAASLIIAMGVSARLRVNPVSPVNLDDDTRVPARV